MEFLLDRDEVVSFTPDLRGAMLSCLGGAVWATQEGDGRDHVLAAGSALAVETPGVVVVWASEPSVLHLGLPRTVASVSVRNSSDRVGFGKAYPRPVVEPACSG